MTKNNQNKKQEWVDELVYQVEMQIERGRVDSSFREVAEMMYEKAQESLLQEEYPDLDNLLDWWESYDTGGPPWSSVASLIVRKRKEGRQELRDELVEEIEKKKKDTSMICPNCSGHCCEECTKGALFDKKAADYNVALDKIIKLIKEGDE